MNIIFHGILRIVGNVKAKPTDQEIDRQVVNRQKGDQQVAPTGPKSKSAGAVMVGVPVWQRNYFEHIIRDNTDYNQIAEYILTNPRRWKEDKLNPINPPL